MTSNKPAGVIIFASVIIILAGIWAAKPVIVPFLLSIFIAVILAPPVFWLEDKGTPKIIAMFAVLLFVFGVFVAISGLVSNSIKEFTKNVNFYKDRVDEYFENLLQYFDGWGIDMSKENIISMVDPGQAIDLVQQVFNGFGSVLTYTFLIFLTVVFLLLEVHSFPKKLRAIVDNPESALSQFEFFLSNFNSYLAIKTLLSIGTGLCVGIWLYILGIDFPILWAMLACLLNFVPNIGSIIAAVPALLLALVQIGPIAVLWSAMGYLVINIVFGNVLEPRLLGKGVGLSTLVVFLSLVFWGWLLGPVGMFLSVPLTMAVKLGLDSHQDSKWIAVMLGSETAKYQPVNAPINTHPNDSNGKNTDNV